MGNDVVRFVAGAVMVAASFYIPGAGFLLWPGMAAVLSPALQRPRQGQDEVLSNPITPAAPLLVVYGTAKVGVRIVEIRVHPTDANLLYIVGVIAIGSEDGSGVQDLLNLYLDEKLAVSGMTDDGSFVTTNVQSAFSGHLNYAAVKGTNSQTHNTELNDRFGSNWPTTADGAGLAYVVLRLKHNPDKYPGLPNIAVTLQGQRVFDPRSDTTAWSQNPALCIRDYLTSTKYGCAIPTSEIDDASFEDAANFCEETVNTTAYNDDRFTCNGVVDTSLPRQSILEQLLSSCRGNLIHQGGKYRLVIRRSASPTSFKLTPDNLTGPIEIIRTGADAPNSITAAWIDPAREFQVREVTWPEAGQSNGFLDADNGIASHARIDLPFTQNYFIAQQIAMTTLREAREDVTILANSHEAALQLQVGDVVPFSNPSAGFVDKNFGVVQMGILPDATLSLVLREHDNAAYTLDTQNTDTAPPSQTLPESAQIAMMRVVLTAGSSWPVPENFNPAANTIELIGGGGGGGGGDNTVQAGGGGGGGGEYRKISNFDPAGLTSIPFVIGAGGAGGAPGGGTGGNGTATSWNNGQFTADFGNGGSVGGGGAGGSGAASPSNQGGTGGNGASGAGSQGGGGGGGAGGLHANGLTGNNGSAGAGGTGGAGGGPNGGAGGASGAGTGGAGTGWGTVGAGGGGGGSTLLQTGGQGGLYGGGGGGAGADNTNQGTGGAGRQGVIVITWTSATRVLV